MKIKRILTNNALVVDDDNRNEKIVCGKGIGYKRNKGDEIDPDLITQTFVLENDANTEKLAALADDLPVEYLHLGNDIAVQARESLKKPLSDSLVLALADHLYAVMKRYHEGLTVSNGLFWEVKKFYEEEFSVGMSALRMIDQRMGCSLPEAEAASIALHIVNSENDGSSITKTMKITVLIQEITNIVKYFFSITYDQQSPYYFRFITHLKFFAKRVFDNEIYESGTDPEFIEIVRAKYSNEFACADRIGEFLKKKYNFPINDEEKMYLAIHIRRIVAKSAEGSDA